MRREPDTALARPVDSRCIKPDWLCVKDPLIFVGAEAAFANSCVQQRREKSGARYPNEGLRAGLSGPQAYPSRTRTGDKIQRVDYRLAAFVDAGAIRLDVMHGLK